MLRRAAAELALLVAIGVFMALLGPFATAERPLSVRAVYWLVVMTGGGLIGIAVDNAVLRRTSAFWPRLAAVSLLMTPGVTALVWLVSGFVFGGSPGLKDLGGLLFQVLVVCVGAMALRQLAWAQARPEPDVREPAGDSGHSFRQRLSARRREAELIAVQAEDHYLRVHTNAGEELITARFGDALVELAAVPGFRTHRSWWVAADALETVRWRRGRGEARLACGLSVPVSRSQAGALKRAGWR
ncbi:LytTR family DNA-binding domain-containing protein [Phenylobacterium sp.]|uniref:LytTR family DNA-binding domain-containing protein n=1 Tax=Phenylobacterium sp. TaxID=1871053 RepID=UPI0039830BA3